MPYIRDICTYYSTPDNHDVHQKVIYTTRKSLFGAFLFATYDTTFVTRATTLYGHVHCFYKWMGPAAVVGATYPIITSIAYSLRNKNDKYNHFIGGAASGSIIGAAKKSYEVGVRSSLLLGLLGLFMYEVTTSGDIYKYLPTKRNIEEFKKSEKSVGFGWGTHQMTMDPKQKQEYARQRELLYNYKS